MRQYPTFALLACLLHVVLSQPTPAPTCGYSSCPATEPDKINVHIVAHTHDDVGWLKTVDQYYYGTKKRYSSVGVQFILDSLVPQLLMDKSKRFIYVEMSFFTKWWREQDEPMRSAVRTLVQEGRLEFINGGWCMNDEATVTYQSTIEQMTLGLKFLNETFGPCAVPKVGWQIDPFGHTNEQASLFAQFGFDGMFFTRESWEDKKIRALNKSLDIMWHGDKILEGDSGSIFTSIFRDGYDAPQGLCFDTLCLDDNLVDNKNSYEYNMDAKGQYFIKFVRNYASSRAFNHILLPMGGDFQYSAAAHNFKNLDKLIKYTRLNAPDLNIFYSTPSCYQYALHQKLSVSNSVEAPLQEKYNDFMPYDSSPTIWWSGFFSSRPSGKLVEREVANLLPVTRLVSLDELIRSRTDASWAATNLDHESRCLLPLWEILGDLQHHDAITGTEKQHVNDDYVRRSTVAMNQCASFIGQVVRKKILRHANIEDTPEYTGNQNATHLKLNPIFLDGTSLCSLLNISQCEPLESRVDERIYNQSISEDGSANSSAKPQLDLETRAVLVNVYNPLSRPIKNHDIRLPCNGPCDIDKVRVMQLSNNSTMKLTRLPSPSGVTTLPFRDAITNYEFLFYIDLAPLSRTSLLIEDLNNDEVIAEESSSSNEFINRNSQIDDALVGAKTTLKRRRARRVAKRRFSEIPVGPEQDTIIRERRYTEDQLKATFHRMVVKLDTETGMIAGLKRASDVEFMNITQKFGFYFPAHGHQPGAYLFRPNSSEATFIERPITYRIFKRKDGSLMEIHQKWADWIWQTIRVDAKKNYIEFDYVVGPVPILYSREFTDSYGREVITRYTTNLKNDHVFLTDSNGRQLLARHRLRTKVAEELGGSFYPVVSTMVLKNAHKQNSSSPLDSLAILVDRPQAGSCLNEGEVEFVIHRRHTQDDEWGVAEALNEPGEDGRGLVTRGKHRLYFKFKDSPGSGAPAGEAPNLFELPESANSVLSYERFFTNDRLLEHENVSSLSTFIVQDPLFDELRIESLKLNMKPVLTFDRLRVPSAKLLAQLGSPSKYSHFSLLNSSLPNNIHLLTLQPRSTGPKELLIRLENLDNPLTVHPFPDYRAYESLLRAYRSESSDAAEVNTGAACDDPIRPAVEVELKYLINDVRIVALEELRLGANVKLSDNKRLNWNGKQEARSKACDNWSNSSTTIRLRPREIRTYLAKFEYI